MLVQRLLKRAMSQTPGLPRQAAEYVRMSTEHQKYSTANQASAIRAYAEKRGFEIVRTYADEGKSGLNIEGREALRRLLNDVQSGEADFQVVLVYDVSRWGRFQDPDEAAAIELSCKRAGVAVHYCAEQFENDGSIGSSIIKTVKRAMAGEYSRELSVKVFAGQSNLIRLGFRQGGPAGFGLRRRLIDQDGNSKCELRRGQHKSLTTDRVILVPGPEEEIELVREVYRRFVESGSSERDIANDLNRRGILTDLGRPWSRGAVHQLLVNEKYVGHNVWGRTSFKLKQKHVVNPREEWIRSDRAFEAIVEEKMFDRAQTIIAMRSSKMSNEEMLERLRHLLTRRGALSAVIIDETDGCPSSSSFRSRFGSLLRAYTLVGFSPAHDYRYVEINRELRRLHPRVIGEVLEGIRSAGGQVSRDERTDLIVVNHEFAASLIIARCRAVNPERLRWKIRLDTVLNPDLTIAVRMDEDNRSARDHYLLPRIDMHEAVLKLAEHNGLSIDAYRFDSLMPLYRMAERANLREAA